MGGVVGASLGGGGQERGVSNEVFVSESKDGLLVADGFREATKNERTFGGPGNGHESLPAEWSR